MKSFSIMALTNVRSFVEFHPTVNLMPREKEKRQNPIVLKGME
jgi:hypothetical protein